VQDNAGYKWDLPVDSVIPPSGVLSVVATCETTGAVLADIGAISTIVTKQFGWTSVSNVVAATPGTPAETDAQLRTRQGLSVALPSSTPLESILASVLNIAGVTRARAYEKDTGEEDDDGLPAHSIALVVEGVTDEAVAAQIRLKKTPGVQTYGTTTVDIASSDGFITPINFFRPTPVQIDVEITIQTLAGYSASLGTAITEYITEYLNSLRIGDWVYRSSLWGAALRALPDISSPAFAITTLELARHEEVTGIDDIEIAFNEVSLGLSANVTVTVT
jgi:uncharacterized phage protein gp47/JayE